MIPQLLNASTITRFQHISNTPATITYMLNIEAKPCFGDVNVYIKSLTTMVDGIVWNTTGDYEESSIYEMNFNLHISMVMCFYFNYI